MCLCVRVGAHAFSGSRTWGVRACKRACIMHAYMIYHIGLSNMIIYSNPVCVGLIIIRVTLDASPYRLHEKANVPRP